MEREDTWFQEKELLLGDGVMVVETQKSMCFLTKVIFTERIWKIYLYSFSSEVVPLSFI